MHICCIASLPKAGCTLLDFFHVIRLLDVTLQDVGYAKSRESGRLHSAMVSGVIQRPNFCRSELQAANSVVLAEASAAR